MTKFYHIVAVSTNGVIGDGDSIPWRIPTDLQYFKEKTSGKYCIVGRKTYDTIKHLKNRTFIVITRQNLDNTENAVFVDSIAAAIKYANDLNVYDCFIIGGAEIYKQTFDVVSKLYVTYVEKSVDGDAFYNIPIGDFTLSKSSDLKSENGNIFYFMEYKKEYCPLTT